jgi:hypothetical protein
MEDYKNELWWIQLQNSIEEFDDTKMSDADLKRWNNAKLAGLISAKVGAPSKAGKANTKEQQSAKGKANTKEQQSAKGKANTSESQSSKNKKRKTLGHPPAHKISVYRFDTNEYVGEYKSISECVRVLKPDKGKIDKSAIGRVLSGIYSQHKGYYFKKI